MVPINRRGQSIEDKLYAFKYFLSGHNLSFVVLKATTSELLGPKKKHLDYLIRLTNEPNVSIPHLSKYLLERALHQEWTVAFKSLIVIQNLMINGNQRFTSFLASSHHDPIFDKICKRNYVTSSLGYEMSKFVRRYARYLNVRLQTYKTLGLDFCRTDTLQQLDESPLKIKSYSYGLLITTLPILQNQFDSLLAFDASAPDLNNGVINSAFSNLYKDFVKLYIAYQAAVIRLLELFFTLSDKKKVQELFEHYKKFLVRMDKVSDFMRVIDSIGMDKTDLPNVSRIPSFDLKLLEQRLRALEAPIYDRTRSFVAPNASSPLIQRGASINMPQISDYISLNGSVLAKRGGSFRSRKPAPLEPVAQFKTPQTRRRQPRANLQLGSKTIEESVDELLRQQYEQKPEATPAKKEPITPPKKLPDTYIGDLLLPESVSTLAGEGSNKPTTSERLRESENGSGSPTSGGDELIDWVKVEL